MLMRLLSKIMTYEWHTFPKWNFNKEVGPTFNFKKQFFDCPSERHPFRLLAHCIGSSRRDWSIYSFMSCNFNRGFRDASCLGKVSDEAFF
jgi:hypothetical protein